MKITGAQALAALEKTEKPFSELFRHGSLAVEIYKPQQTDQQTPHDRDEIYVVFSGSGQFECRGKVTAFGPGDFLFAPAFTPHRFVEFSDDFATWVFFYGPRGGETESPVEIREWDPAFGEAFFRLNKAWIEVDYDLEPLDIAVLSNPEEHIIRKGGSILSALIDGEVTGVIGLRPFGDNCVELTKMAVDERWRGRGIGEKLMHAVLETARKKGVHKVVLFSNTRTSAAAVRIYYKVGFQEVPLEPGVYQRANIKMEYLF
jgi:GNAT superfamily N-acetyltransferase